MTYQPLPVHKEIRLQKFPAIFLKILKTMYLDIIDMAVEGSELTTLY